MPTPIAQIHALMPYFGCSTVKREYAPNFDD
jgi:hypothetical protein